MSKNKLLNQSFKLSSTVILFGSMLSLIPTLSSCGGTNTNNEAINIGSYDGTDWQGYVSGRLHCELNYYDSDSASIDGYLDDGVSSYKAHNLVIPDFIRYPNGKTIPLKTIYYSFNNSDNLTGTLTLGKNLTEIDDSFNHLTNVTGDLIIPNDVYSLCYCFNQTSFNKNLVIGDMVENIDEGCFEDNNFEDIVVSKYNYTFGLATNVGENCHILVWKNQADGACLLDWTNLENMFDSLAFGELTIPEDVTTIAHGAFYGCSALKGDLVIPESVVSIGEYAFYGAGFDGKLSIGSKLTSIGQGTFKNCNFSSLEISNENLNYGLATNVGPNCDALVAKNGDDSFLVDYNNQNSIISGLAFGTLTIPAETTNISDVLLKNCTHLDGVTVEESSTSIYKVIKSGVEEGSSNEILSSNNPGFLLNVSDIPPTDGEDMTIKSRIPFAIGDLTIPDTILGHKVVAIGNSADASYDKGDRYFAGLNIGKLTTGVNLTTIYGSAFRDCTITEVDLTNVTTIHESAFEGRTITKVSMPKITSLSNESFESQSHIVSITVDASVDPVTLSVPNDYPNIVLFQSCNSHVGELIDISEVGTFKAEWRTKLNLSSSWTWTN